MLRDHLRSFWRGVVNNKLTTGINVAGLALGLAVFFALTFYVQREFSYDTQWRDAERIYVIAGQQEMLSGNSVPRVPLSFYVLGTHLLSRYPDAFEAYARNVRSQGAVVVDEKEYANKMLNYVEPGFLNLLQLDTVEGSLQAVFTDPHSIAISAQEAEIMFGQQSPLGRILTFNSQQNSPADYVIKAVYRVPAPSSLEFMNFLALLDSVASPLKNIDLDSWSRNSPAFADNYLKLNPGFSARQLEAELRAFMDENHYMDAGDNKTRFVFMPLRDVHLIPSSFNPGGGTDRLRILVAIGVMVLLISGCNFVMLGTLRSVDRMREVGIRKAVGSETRQLLRQCLFDVFVQALTAALLAVVLLELGLPVLQAHLGVNLALDFWHWRNLAQCLGIVAAFTLLSGFYPAVLMSRGQPAALLRNSSGAMVSSGTMLRRVLVGVQFAVVIGLLLASAVVRQQIEYTRNRDRGYSLENIMGVRINDRSVMAKTAAVANEFKQVPGVAGAAVGAMSPGMIIGATPTPFTHVAADGKSIEATLQTGGGVGAGYFGVMSVPLLAGREFSTDVEGVLPPGAQGEISNVLLNVAAIHALNFTTPKDAIDELITAELVGSDGQITHQSMRVIGVVADTQFASMMLPPRAEYYRFTATNIFIPIKFTPDADQAAVLNDLRGVWQQLVGDVAFLPLSPGLMEMNVLADEEFEARIVIGSTLLALVIALLGLYGLVEATVAKRVKEIGVRKVMGAGNTAIVALLLWQFSKPIVIANLVAWPLGFWGISRWLQRFPYQLDMGVIAGSALAASIVALLIAWLTISMMATRAASAKPVLALRYE
ncbi:MAG: ABC transporter permease [Pseudomonadales bacterium]|nr:ABC transporter permease [Pseudomonadales bacterium]